MNTIVQKVIVYIIFMLALLSGMFTPFNAWISILVLSICLFPFVARDNAVDAIMYVCCDSSTNFTNHILVSLSSVFMIFVLSSIGMMIGELIV